MLSHLSYLDRKFCKRMSFITGKQRNEHQKIWVTKPSKISVVHLDTIFSANQNYRFRPSII